MDGLMRLVPKKTMVAERESAGVITNVLALGFILGEFLIIQELTAVGRRPCGPGG
jgi:hypothetical protein